MTSVCCTLRESLKNKCDDTNLHQRPSAAPRLIFKQNPFKPFYWIFRKSVKSIKMNFWYLSHWSNESDLFCVFYLHQRGDVCPFVGRFVCSFDVCQQGYERKKNSDSHKTWWKDGSNRFAGGSGKREMQGKKADAYIFLSLCLTLWDLHFHHFPKE